MDMRMRMERTVWIACIVSNPVNEKSPCDDTAGRSHFSSLFYVAASGGKSPRTRIVRPGG